MQAFKAFSIEQSKEDTLPSYIKGAALFDKVDGEEGLWVFDPLGSDYLAVEYNEDNNQWYFIDQDSHSGNWIATSVVPSSYNLGRKSICSGKTKAIEVDKETEKRRGQHTVPQEKSGNNGNY